MNSTCRKLTEREITLVRRKKILFLSELDKEESHRKKEHVNCCSANPAEERKNAGKQKGH